VSDAFHAALTAARAHGLPTDDPLVVRDLTNVIVHLRPAPVVARVQLTIAEIRGREWAETEMRAARFLASAGAPVAPPAAGVDPGPHEQDGMLVTFWRYVEHDPARADAREAGRSLRALHDAFAQYEGELPTCDRLAEVRRMFDALPATDANTQLREFANRLPPLDGQPLHGDAHLRNVLWSPDGPLWSDLENVCRGPREYDLACIRFRPLPETEPTLAAYGAHDEAEVDRALVYVTLFLAAATQVLAQRVGGDAQAEADRRVARALAYARAA
jgi:Phosphotransferase enzyme family